MPTFVDLSHEIHHGMVTYPGLPPAALSTVLSREESRGRYAPGVEFHIGSATLCTNTGTYLDTPAHRYEDGWDLTGLPLERCADLPAVVVDLPAGADQRPFGFDATHVADLPLSGAAVLFRTGWSEHWGTDAYLSSDHPYLSAAGTEALVAAGVTLVGIDSLNIDSTVGNDRPAHSGLLAAGIPIVEHLTGLAALPAQGARFSAVPIKVAGLGTFAVRAFATIADRPIVDEVVFDGHDVSLLAEFWAAVTGGNARVRSEDWATVTPARPGPGGCCWRSSGFLRPSPARTACTSTSLRPTSRPTPGGPSISGPSPRARSRSTRRDGSRCSPIPRATSSASSTDGERPATALWVADGGSPVADGV